MSLSSRDRPQLAPIAATPNGWKAATSLDRLGQMRHAASALDRASDEQPARARFHSDMHLAAREPPHPILDRRRLRSDPPRVTSPLWESKQSNVICRSAAARSSLLRKNPEQLCCPARMAAALRVVRLRYVATTDATSPQQPFSGTAPPERAEVNLYWLPLGAGGHCVRVNGRIFEAVSARAQHRRPCDLYHSALEVQVGPARHVIEMAPVWNERAKERGVVAEGSVGMQGAGRLRLFRYEVRCWRDGRIPDIGEAVDGPQCLSTSPECAARVLELVRQVPTAVWGRDELRTGDMWNSNSLTSWLIVRSGIATEHIQPPSGGRAPGWRAGLVAASGASEASTAIRSDPVGLASGV